MKREEKTAGGIVFDERFEQVYLIYKKERDEWLLPKGHIKEGESVTGAAKREVLEETGLNNVVVIGLSPCATNVFNLKNGNIKIVSFFVMVAGEKKTKENRFKKDEGLSGKWFFVEEAIRKAKYDDIRQAIKNAYEKTSRFRKTS